MAGFRRKAPQLLLLHPRQICNGSYTRTPAFAATFTSFRRPKKATAVKARICPQLKSCTVTDFWLRDSFYRDTAPMPLTNILYRDSLPASIKLVPPLLICKSGAGSTRVMLNKFCTRMAKTAPPSPLSSVGAGIPSLGRRSLGEGVPCTVTALWLKYRDPDGARVG